jgi:hypothetical protein
MKKTAFEPVMATAQIRDSVPTLSGQSGLGYSNSSTIVIGIVGPKVESPRSATVLGK